MDTDTLYCNTNMTITSNNNQDQSIEYTVSYNY
jgi:hypothetical protein